MEAAVTLGVGFLADQLGSNGVSYVFAGITVVAAMLFFTLMPETGGNGNAGKLGEEGQRAWMTAGELAHPENREAASP